jgi:hypothetical protein
MKSIFLRLAKDISMRLSNMHMMPAYRMPPCPANNCGFGILMPKDWRCRLGITGNNKQ